MKTGVRPTLKIILFPVDRQDELIITNKEFISFQRICSFNIVSLKRNRFGSVFGKRDLLAIFHVMKYDVKCGMCLHKFDCRETTLPNAANHSKIFLIEFEICL